MLYKGTIAGEKERRKEGYQGTLDVTWEMGEKRQRGSKYEREGLKYRKRKEGDNVTVNMSEELTRNYITIYLKMPKIHLCQYISICT